AINPFSLPGGFGLPNDFTAAGGSIAGDNNSEQKSDGWALFTHDTFNLADNLQLTGGFRWSWERKKGRYEILGTVDTPVDIGLNGTPFVSLAANATTGTSMCEQPTSTDLGPNALFGFRSALCDNAGWDDTEIETAPTGTVKLAYQPTEDIHTYLSYARGYKAGGYNYTGTANQQTAASIAAQELDPAAPTVLANEFRFDAEKVDAFEIGVKTNLLDNRLTVNSAIFYEDFKDFQVLSFTGTEFTLYNLPKATSKGIEVDMAYALTDYIYTTLAGAYTIARYGHFSEPEYQPQSGKRLTNSPRFQGNASVNIAQPIPQTTWTAILNTNVSYRSRVNTGSNLNPEQEQSSFWLTNAQVGIQSPNSQWTGLFWINNINNKRYNTIVFASPLQPGNWSSFVNPQRTFGVTLNYDY
ncbi:MAG: TonB-dependent receptor, partial [Myxococcales bacterium]|nr:TonB-dependent receptor [Myxococcales bacterium]